MKTNSVVRTVLWVIAIGLWLVTGIAGLVFFVRLTLAIPTAFSAVTTRPSDTAMENAFNIGSTASPYAIMTTLCAIAWTMFCKSQAARS
jgi:heme/copper-type cytochrome/quinol oxidase subunit 2